MQKGKIIIISAPSGCGKSTIINQLLTRNLNLNFSISATTRSPREGEKNGVNYYFITPEEFRKSIENEEFVEWEQVYTDRYYGTYRREIERICEAGNNVVLDIDVKGGVNVKRIFGAEAKSIFIQPPSISTLRERLISRATDDMTTIEQRLARAEYEISFATEFDTIVVNDILENAVEDTYNIIHEFINA